MLIDLIAVVGLALLCGGWVVLQRWIARRDPETRGPEHGCTSCSCGAGGPDANGRCRAAPGDGEGGQVGRR